MSWCKDWKLLFSSVISKTAISDSDFVPSDNQLASHSKPSTVISGLKGKKSVCSISLKSNVCWSWEFLSKLCVCMLFIKKNEVGIPLRTLSPSPVISLMRFLWKLCGVCGSLFLRGLLSKLLLIPKGTLIFFKQFLTVGSQIFVFYRL